MSSFGKMVRLSARYGVDFMVVRDRRNKKRDQIVPSDTVPHRLGFSRKRWFVAFDTGSVHMVDGQHLPQELP